MATNRNRRLWLALGGLAVVLLAAAVFTLGSLNPPVRPERGNGFVILFALSTFIFAAFMIFGLVLLRSLIRLWTERRAGHLGSRFKTKMLLGAMGISLFPIVFLFFFSYALVNRTLNLWFPRPLEIAQSEGQSLLDDFQASQYARLHSLAEQAASQRMSVAEIDRNFGSIVDAAWKLDQSGKVTEGAKFAPPDARPGPDAIIHIEPALFPAPLRDLRMAKDEEIWRAGAEFYLTAHAPATGGSIVLAQRLPQGFLQRVEDMQKQSRIYAQQREQIRAYKKQILLTLLLITVLLLSTTMWVAQFLAKLITVPIQAMAEATTQVARGNFDYRVPVQAHDELGTLVVSFNEMTTQLGDSRRQINEFTRNLQQAFEERERRRELMEAILENIPTGVVSLSPTGDVLRVNTAAASILGEPAHHARTLAELAGEQVSRDIQHLMRSALRLGVASRELELSAPGRNVNAAVTVTALGTRRNNPGYLLVIDDLTELLRAQKAAAWQEVARRIAHEIKNPLTPIQLSAQRLLRYINRAEAAGTDAGASTMVKEYQELSNLVSECSHLIEHEVSTLASLVNEFSQFVRFPSARLVPTDINEVVKTALDTFRGRLEGITLRTELAPGLPPVRGDAELLRLVLVNLVDNAAEVLEGSPVREISVSTRLDSRGEAVEVVTADTGPGISPADKERLFFPQFSTKERGTGLGLAIASRIVMEHNGALRVEDNFPLGARFVIRLPAAEATVAPAATHAESRGES